MIRLRIRRKTKAGPRSWPFAAAAPCPFPQAKRAPGIPSSEQRPEVVIPQEHTYGSRHAAVHIFGLRHGVGEDNITIRFRDSVSHGVGSPLFPWEAGLCESVDFWFATVPSSSARSDAKRVENGFFPRMSVKPTKI